MLNKIVHRSEINHQNMLARGWSTIILSVEIPGRLKVGQILKHPWVLSVLLYSEKFSRVIRHSWIDSEVTILELTFVVSRTGVL